MKTRTLVTLLSFVFTVTAFLMLASCYNAPTPTLEGTWVNSEYDGLGDFPFPVEPVPLIVPAKMVVTAGGEFFGHTVYHSEWYYIHDGTEPLGTVTIHAYNETVDSEGNLMIKASRIYTTGWVKMLIKIHEDDKILEENSCNPCDDYPNEIDSDDDWYEIYYRPE